MKHLFYKPRIIFTVYIVATVIASLHLIWLGNVPFGGVIATSYNNYFIYTDSFSHLIHGQNLYITYPGSYWQKLLIMNVFVFTTISHTDIFPFAIRHAFIYPFYIKAVPCIIACIILHYQLILIQRYKPVKGNLTLSNL